MKTELHISMGCQFTLQYVYNMKPSHIYFHEQLLFAYGEHSESFLVVFEAHSAVV